jgi:hypothetical protein
MTMNSWLKKSSTLGLALLGTGALMAADSMPGMQHADAGKPMSDAQVIASAESAAPHAIAMHATIVVANADGSMRTVRKGTNAFTCMPDSPETPGPDPMCWDKATSAWIDAWMKHTLPPAGKTGFMYMLAGGTDASNTDPYAKAPTTANHWIKTGPHIMIVGADASFYDGYPKGADPDTSQPYVMWAGTPYQHLMAPVK